METLIRRLLAISRQIHRPSFHSQRFALEILADALTKNHVNSHFQFFTQSNPLNNLNIASSIPPILQRPSSASEQQQRLQSLPQGHANGDLQKQSLAQRNVAQPNQASYKSASSTASEIQRKYSLPMNTLSNQPMVSSSLSFNPSLIRKQSAPNIHPISSVKQQPHSSPSRARDRNNFDKVPTAQDVQQLSLLKGYLSIRTVYAL